MRTSVAWLPALPVLIPFLTASVLVLVRRYPEVQRAVSVAGAAALLAAGAVLVSAVCREGTLVAQAGNWPAPFGITLVADRLAAILVAIAGLVGLTAVIYALADIPEDRRRAGVHPVMHLLLAGVCGAFLTGDLFNLFVWFEVMLMSSFVLLALGARAGHLEGAVKYLVLNFLSSGLFLAAAGLLYGSLGTLNLADLAVRLRSLPEPGTAFAAGVLLLVSFGIKAAVFPLFSWLPASYHTAPIAISALFAGLLTKVGVYALMRSYALFFSVDAGWFGALLLWAAVATMLVGVLGAAAQYEIRRILSWHIISQIGYMTLGIALFTQGAVAAAVFYVIHHILVKTNLFFLSGAIEQAAGSDRLDRIGGLYRSAPLLSGLFLIPAFSLGGIPPLSGFFAKFGLLQAGFEIGAWVPLAVALLVGLLTLFSMTKIWAEVFWKEPPAGAAPAGNPGVLRLIPIAVLASSTMLISLWPEPLLGYTAAAGQELVDGDAYIQAVLGVVEGGGQ
ncbi:MAG: Na+/H+ antiporter subunit D [Acidobacteriota bacterium]